jgi:hypothetical protein
MEWNELQEARTAVIADLTARAPAGYIGRTALMKLCYLLQIVRGVPLGYHFTLFSYGPFDAGVLSDLATAEALGAVKSTVTLYKGGYGYKIRKGEDPDAVTEASRSFLRDHEESIEWVLKEFGAHGSGDLELESTLDFVDREAAGRSESLTIPILAQRVKDVKPHFERQYIVEKAEALSSIHLLESARPALAGSGR